MPIPRQVRIACGIFGAALAPSYRAAAESAASAQQIVGVDQALKTILGLALVVVVIVALAWVGRRLTGGRSGTAAGLRVVGAVPIGARERIVLVDVGGTQLVLGVAPGRVQTLHVRPTPEGRAEGELPDPGFRGTLERVLTARAHR